MDISRLPMDRHLDPRWNGALDLLTAIWNRLGAEGTVAALTALLAVSDEDGAELESGSEENGEVA